MLSMAAVPLLVGGLSVSASAEEGFSLANNLKLKGEIRPRYEYADVDHNIGDTRDAAQALTARTKLLVSADLLGVEGLSGNIGLISVNNFGWTEYNDKTNSDLYDQTHYDVIADPQVAMLSNAEINYKINKTLLHAGRGQVNLDNQRFIGTVGWRQLERSYDTVFVADNSIENLNLLAAWVYGFQGVVGDAAKETQDTNTVLLHGSYKVMDPLTITAYDYMIANFADTYGLSLTGKIKSGNINLSYRAEYAQQSDATMTIHDVDTNGDGIVDNDYKADASYYNIDIGANISGVIIGANYEFLSGVDRNQPVTSTDTAFQTPLATGHKFNGWADEFLTTPEGGLVDANIRLGYKAKGIGKLLAVYHDFSTDKSMDDVNGLATDDLGSEIDFMYVNKVPGVKNLSILLKGALYSKGKVAGWTNDKEVYWAQLDWKFSTK